MIQATKITAILIENSLPTTPSLHVTASWNLDRSTCDTYLDDHLVEVWQTSQRGLGPLFID